MFKKDLGDGFEIREIDSAELKRIQDLHFEKIFANRIEEIPDCSVSKEDQKKIRNRNLKQESWQLRLGLYKGTEPIGWHFGHSIDPETFYMKNSAIIENFRAQGLYSKMLDVILEKIEGEGFQVVTSKHHPNNPGVLVPKLKRGFIISSMEFHERFRFLIELRLFVAPVRRRAYCKALGLDL